MHLPEIDRYGRGESPLHNLDERLKLLALALFLLAVNLTWDLSRALLFLGVSVALLLLSRLPLGFVLWHLRAPAGLALILAIFLALFGNRTPTSAPLALPGLTLAITVLCKILACFIFFLALVATAPLFETVRAARALGVPEKLLILFLFTYRYLFTLLDQARNLSLALQARGFREGTNRRTYEIKARLYALLFLRAYEDTEKVLLAMYARGFSSPKVPPLEPLTPRQLLKASPLLGLAILLLLGNFFW
ncbi:energy-coupling factor transporter transmembrane protein EcfT [Thermosulfurimonas sp. F29]|uniref:energy-coupling factor transporter transmembrane component T family protein n=1 Tax=Thermosulfurimonas sp. F29 TaxID=2867247 RepID=UPI001C83632E|nr:energy-coupling factor transporter transmembrane component T [Thermosulfurimonas sp. F29]MBX6423841.1 energy-coupling factor transporter transmembrane protein EcfT [Thermosulfurimonas sp. F29]